MSITAASTNSGGCNAFSRFCGSTIRGSLIVAAAILAPAGFSADSWAQTAVQSIAATPTQEGKDGTRQASHSNRPRESKNRTALSDTGGPDTAAGSDARAVSLFASISLEELLEAALRDNPDIRLAETKVREAEAELKRIQLNVVQRITALRREWEVQKAKVDEYALQLKRMQRLREANAAPEEELRRARINEQVSRLTLLKLEEELPFLLGRTPTTASEAHIGKPSTSTKSYPLGSLLNDQIVAFVRQAVIQTDSKATAEAFAPNKSLIVSGTAEAHAVAGAIIEAVRRLAGPEPSLAQRTGWAVSEETAEKLRKAINTPVKVNFARTSLSEILRSFQEQLAIRFVGSENLPSVVDLDLGEVPLGTALEAIHDLSGADFQAREYGILVTIGAGFGGGGKASLIEWWRSQLNPERNQQ